MIDDFRRQRAQFERLAAMAAEDSQLVRVSNGWFSDAAGTIYEKPEPRLLTPERWEEYRRLFRSLNLDAGVTIVSMGIFLERSALGLGISGSMKGYARLREPPAQDQLCESLDSFRSETPHQTFCYRHIEGPWYLHASWD